MRFDLTDLGLFLAVLDAGSITHGAAAAGLSLAAASERLRDMEAAGGTPLLERGRRGVLPTRAGETLAHHARLVLRQIGAMRADLAEEAAGLRVTVRLLANSAAVTGPLAERLGGFLAAHPRIDVALDERASRVIVRSVAAGLAAFGIVSDAVDTAALDTHPFAADRLVAVFARAHPLAVRRSLTLAEIAREPVIGYAGALQVHLDEEAARLGLRLRPRVRLGTFEGICRTVAAGAGLAVVPEGAARRARRTLPLACVPLAEPFAMRRLVLCRRPGEALEAPAQALFDHLAAPA